MADKTLEDLRSMTDEEFVKNYVSKLENPSPGHQLENGLLDLKYEEDEIRNKIGLVFNYVKTIEDLGLTGTVVEKFKRTFPTKVEFIEGLIPKGSDYDNLRTAFSESKPE